MNKLKYIFLLTVALLGLASCVGSSRNEMDQSVLGYMEYRPDIQKNVLIGKDLLAYHAPEFDERSFFPEKSKWLIYCNVDLDRQPADYREVTLKSEPLPFIDGEFKQSADTIQIQDNEQPVKSLRAFLFQNALYAESVHMDSIGQQNKLELFYSEKDTLVNYGDNNIYTLYLRSFQQTAAMDTLVEELRVYNAFDLAPFLESKKTIEKEKAKSVFYLQVKCLTNVTKGDPNTGSPNTPTEKEYIPVPVE